MRKINANEYFRRSEKINIILLDVCGETIN